MLRAASDCGVCMCVCVSHPPILQVRVCDKAKRKKGNCLRPNDEL